jgi:hypothetical protein
MDETVAMKRENTNTSEMSIPHSPTSVVGSDIFSPRCEVNEKLLPFKDKFKFSSYSLPIVSTSSATDSRPNSRRVTVELARKLQSRSCRVRGSDSVEAVLPVQM